MHDDMIEEYELQVQEIDDETARAARKRIALMQMIAFLKTDHPHLERDLNTVMDEQAAQIREKRIPGGPYEHYEEQQGRQTQEALFVQQCSILLHTIHMTQYIEHVTQQRRAQQ